MIYSITQTLNPTQTLLTFHHHIDVDRMAPQADFNALAEELGRQYPDRARLWFAYDEPLSHLIYAGADMLLVPSIFEPCGLTQMIGMRCGLSVIGPGSWVLFGVLASLESCQAARALHVRAVLADADDRLRCARARAPSPSCGSWARPLGFFSVSHGSLGQAPVFCLLGLYVEPHLEAGMLLSCACPVPSGNSMETLSR